MIVQTVVPRDENNWSRKILSIWKVMTMMERGLKDNQRISFRRAELFFFCCWNTGNPQERRNDKTQVGPSPLVKRHCQCPPPPPPPPWNFESGIPETELPFSSFHSTPKGIGGLEKWGGEGKNTRRESAVGALLSACPADVGQGRNEFQPPFELSWLPLAVPAPSFIHTLDAREGTLCNPLRAKQPLQLLESRTLPLKKNIHCPRRWTTCPLSKFPPLVPLSFNFRPVSYRKKFSNTVYYIPSNRTLSFVESKVSARFIRNLFRLFWNSFSTLFFYSLFALYNYI